MFIFSLDIYVLTINKFDVLFAGGQVFFFRDLLFSPHFKTDSDQMSEMTLTDHKTQITKKCCKHHMVLRLVLIFVVAHVLA